MRFALIAATPLQLLPNGAEGIILLFAKIGAAGEESQRRMQLIALARPQMSWPLLDPTSALKLRKIWQSLGGFWALRKTGMDQAGMGSGGKLGNHTHYF